MSKLQIGDSVPSTFIDEYKQEIKLNNNELEETKNKMKLVKSANAETVKDTSCNLIYDNAVLTKTCVAIGNIIINNYEKIEEQEQVISHKNNQIKHLSKYIGESVKEVINIVSQPLTVTNISRSKHMEKFRKAFIKEINNDNKTNNKIGYK